MTAAVPTVRIGMVTGREQLRVFGTGDVMIENPRGEQLGVLRTDGGIEARRLSGKAATMVTYLRLSIHQSLEEAERKAHAEAAAAGAGLHIHTVGVRFSVGEFTVDNREHWLLAGPFSGEEEARQAQQNLGEPWENPIVSMAQHPADGAFSIGDRRFDEPVRLRPADPEEHLALADVRVGIGFHWDHLEKQSYRGTLEVGVGIDGRLQAVNELSLEDYLASVNSSEMSPDCHPDLLRAQTVAARSTVLATMGKHHHNETYHLCADDHCQCYHGLGVEQEPSPQAVHETWGEVLLHDEAVCDARYSKICGGVTEAYEYVWDERPIPYLVSVTDGPHPLDPPYDTEAKVRAYIDSSPDVYCNTTLHALPDGQQQSRDLFRWEVSYSREELEEIIRQKSGRDIGKLLEIRPLLRGPSGRLVAIEVVGSRQRLRAGKELVIRGLLSPSHLYSSCFYIVPTLDSSGEPTRFSFRGAGWGHGVGLCQIGAAVMAAQGISYPQILSHYYRGTELRGLW